MFLGLLAAGVGAWSLHHLRDQSSTCVPGVTRSEIFGISSNCVNQVGLEYISMGILIAGMFTFVFALLLMKRQRNSRLISPDGSRRLIGTPGESLEMRRRFSSQFRKKGDEGRVAADPAGPRDEGDQPPDA